MSSALPSPAPDSCVMYLVRHGATANNLADPPVLQGRGVNFGLSDEGKCQAEQTARMLSTQNLTAVYSSPLLRAVETAEAVARPHDLQVSIVEPLAEVDVGLWEGRSWTEISQTEAEAYRRFVADPAVYGYAGGENLQQVLDRSLPAIERVMQEHVGQQIVVVAHNVVNRTVLGSLLGISTTKWRSLSQDNCGVNVIQFRGGKMKVRTINSVFHLAAESC